jgi:hypothetical protein
LLETWTQALIGGYFPAGLPLSREDRQATVEQLSALACIGLREDRLVVRFDDLESRRQDRHTTIGTEFQGADPPPRTIIDVGRGQSRRRPDPRWAATWGMQLGLVEAGGGGVRFPHSIMQAYLGSRLMDVAMADPQYRDEALRNPGQELLIALVMYSRSMVRDTRPDGPAQARIGGTGPGDEGRSLQGLLREAANYRADVKAFDLYAAALEIDSIDAAPAHGAIADELQTRWLELWARDPWLLEEAKLNVVRRFGEAARTIAERYRKEPDCLAEPAYRQLYRIGCSEPSFPIRLAAAQEIGAGGAEAFAALHDVLGPRDPPDMSDARAALGAGEPGDRRVGHEPPPHRDLPDEGEREEREWAEKAIRAWLAPLLAGSVTGLQSLA